MEEFLDFKNIITPYEEMLSYETLWAMEGMTETNLSKLFEEYNALPSVVLKNQISLFNSDIEKLKNKVEKYLSNKIGKFSIVVNRDFQYPDGLRAAKHPIELFYFKGNLDLLKTRCMSVVGARKVSKEGLLRAEKLTRALVKEGFTIISGLAKGVDTQAHKTALMEKGNIIGVIGTPIDEFYPKENKELQQEIAKNHLLVSQVPFYRYSKEPFSAHRQHFPRRNVTMASLSEGTIIVEASDTSGSLTQARACIQQNKKLFILDSCFKNPDIKWPYTYEKKGAIRVKGIKDILQAL